MLFSGQLFAQAWRSVAIAASDDPDRPALFRATNIELHPDGMRIVATDSYLMLHAWIHAKGDDDGSC